MALYVNGKKVVNSLIVDGKTVNRYYILDPEVSEALYSSSSSSGMSAYIPYTAKVKADASGGTPEMGAYTTFGGSYKAVIRRVGYQVGSVFCGSKIKGGKYKKLYMECEVLSYSGSWYQAVVVLTPTKTVSSDAIPTGAIKTIYLASADKTVEQINSQTGVVINSTNNLLLSAQTVEVDISNITQDFYFAFWNCDRTVQFRSIYLE